MDEKEVAAAVLEHNRGAMKQRSLSISFRPVVRDDFARIVRWRREPHVVERGLGPLIIRDYVEQIVVREYPNARRVVSSPDPRNTRSIRALEKAGFVAGPVIDVQGHEERLCILACLNLAEKIGENP